VSVVVIENSKGDGWKETGKVKKEGRRQNFLRRLFANDAIDVIRNVMRKTSTKIFANALPKLTEFPNILCWNSNIYRLTFHSKNLLSKKKKKKKKNSRYSPRHYLS
jgi:hypothetical protein